MLRALFLSIGLLHLGSVVMSMTCVSGGEGDWNHAVRGRLALPLGGKLVPVFRKKVVGDTDEQLRGHESRRAS